MHNPDPTQIPYITYLWIYLVSMLSAIATYLNRLCVGEKIRNPFVMFFKDLCYCLLGGIVTYFLASASNLGGMQIAALVSVGSHMGARLIFAMEGILMQNRLFKLVNSENKEIKDDGES